MGLIGKPLGHMGRVAGQLVNGFMGRCCDTVHGIAGRVSYFVNRAVQRRAGAVNATLNGVGG